MSSGLKTNEELQQCVDKLRGRISDVIEKDKEQKFGDDLYLIQWLKRFNFKVERTESMIRDSIKWRKSKNIDTLVNVDKDLHFQELAQDFPIHIDSKSKRGLPVFVFNGNGVDFVEVVKKHGREFFLEYIYFIAAKAEQMLMKAIQNIRKECPNLDLADFVANSIEGTDGQALATGVVAIASFRDISMWMAKSPVIVSVMFEGAKVFAYYFPVIVSHVFFINANKVLIKVFKLMKPLIASPFYPIDIFDSEKEKWSAAILQHVDASQLTEEFGGNILNHKK